FVSKEIRADICMDGALLQQCGACARLQQFDADFLGVVGRVIWQLMAGIGPGGGEHREQHGHEEYGNRLRHAISTHTAPQEGLSPWIDHGPQFSAPRPDLLTSWGRDPHVSVSALSSAHIGLTSVYPDTFGQVWSIQVYVEVGSPLGQPGGA